MGAQIETNLLKIRASAAGLLMSGGAGITPGQLVELQELQARKEAAAIGNAKALTANMEAKLQELFTKKNAPPSLGETAKSYVEKLWLETMYGYKEPIVTDELLKGNLVEQDGIALVSDVIPVNEFRVKNKQFFEDEYFIGTPDIVLKTEPFVEDIKSAWSIKTFFEKRDIDPIYYAQGQVYLHLTGKQFFRVHYCLLNTPIDLVHNEQKRFFWKYGGDENNKHFQSAAEQIARNHIYDGIPNRNRVKTFEFEYDPRFIQRLQERVVLARQYFDTLTL